MVVEGNPWVFSLLAAVFIAVGVHLFFWSRRQTRLLKRYAALHGLEYRQHDEDGKLEKTVNAAMGIKQDGLARAFDRCCDIIRHPSATVFRMTELLDLNPYGDVQSSHHVRTAVFFSLPNGPEGIFQVDPRYKVRQLYPSQPDVSVRISTLLKSRKVPAPPCTLSVSFSQEYALAYLEPVIVGSLTENHLDYLLTVADHLQEEGPTGS